MSQAPCAANTTCPCGSTRPFGECCEPALNRTRLPDTAEALMRSRYSAFHLGRYAYLVETAHPSRREGLSAESLARDCQRTRWLNLTIRETLAGQAQDLEGTVTFVASFLENNRQGALQETSRFVREEGRWFYLDGETELQHTAEQPGRNSPCPCGSGKKFKRCCAN